MGQAEDDNPAIGMAYVGRQDSMINKYGTIMNDEKSKSIHQLSEADIVVGQSEVGMAISIFAAG